jgi:hypothetical protein
LKCGFQKEVSASKSPTFFSRKPLGASNTDHNMTRQINFKPTADQPLANAYFGTFAFLPTRQATANKNVKEPKFSNRTTTAQVLSTGSVLHYKFPKTRHQKNKQAKLGLRSQFCIF